MQPIFSKSDKEMFVIRFGNSSIIARNPDRSVGAKDATGATAAQPEQRTMVTKNCISFQKELSAKMTITGK